MTQQVAPRLGNEEEHRRLLAVRANASLAKEGDERMLGPLPLAEYAKASLVTDLPASAHRGAWIYVTDEVGGAVPAFSDGTNWRRCTDRAIVS